MDKSEVLPCVSFSGGISAKLYCFAFLSLLAVAYAVDLLDLFLQDHGNRRATSLRRTAFSASSTPTRLDLLLAQSSPHRREHAARRWIGTGFNPERNELEQIKQRLSRIDDRHRPEQTAIARRWRAASPASLPPLFEAADQVAFYANEFAQDKAVEEANGYAHIANGIERMIKNYRDLRLQEAQEAIAFVSATAKSLAVWVLLSRVRGDRADRSDRACHHAPGAVAARRHHPGDDPALPATTPPP